MPLYVTVNFIFFFKEDVITNIPCWRGIVDAFELVVC